MSVTEEQTGSAIDANDPRSEIKEKAKAILPKISCPHCNEYIPAGSSPCVFCNKTVDFDPAQLDRALKKREVLRKIRLREERAAAKVNILIGTFVGVLSILLFLGSYSALGSDTPMSTVIVGLLLSIAGIGTSLWMLKSAIGKLGQNPDDPSASEPASAPPASAAPNEEAPEGNQDLPPDQ